ncbi:MAG: VCBS repeat-containing protein, partial [Bacteroidetes bacterium]|nr:VCBS repeat-containing protein [Bacteroidota bacterium]
MFSGVKGSIKNLGVVDATVSANLLNGYAGILIGYYYPISGSVIENCFTTGTVTGREAAGGLIGGSSGAYGAFGMVRNCYSTANVYSTNTGVSNAGLWGGLIGTSRTAVENCYARGIVTASVETKAQGGIGGFAGICVDYENIGTIDNCYSTGLVTPAASGTNNTGGFLGCDATTYNNGDIRNCFWDTQTSERATSAGGTGKNTAEMKTLGTFTGAGWDFSVTPVWGIDAGRNKGYPYLAWEYYDATRIGVYQSKTTGSWSEYTIWKWYDGYGFVDASVGQVPDGTTDITISAEHAVTLSGNLTLAAGKTLTVDGTMNPAADVVISGSGTLTGSGTAKVTRITGTNDFGTQYTITNKTLDDLIVEFAGTALQQIDALEYGALKLNNAAGTTVAGNLTVNGTSTLTAGNLNIGAYTLTINGTLNPATGVVIGGSGTVTGSGTVKVTRGTVEGPWNHFSDQYTVTNRTLTNLTVEFVGSTAQHINGITYGGLKLNNANGFTVGGDFTVNKTLTLTSGVLNLGAGRVNINGGLTRTGGSITAGVNSTVWIGDAGSEAQLSIPAGTFGSNSVNYFYLDRANGAALNGALTVEGILGLTSGVLATGNNTLSIGMSGSASRTGGHVSGNLAMYFAADNPDPKTFNIGTANAYTPATIDIDGSGGTAGTITATTTGSEHANIATSELNTAKDINRYWSITPGTAALGDRTYKLKLDFLGDDVPGDANTDNFEIRRYSGDTWSAPTSGDYTRSGTSTEYSNLTAFSDFVVGESEILLPAVPILAMPEDGATGVSINPTFSWNAADGAESYTLQVSTVSTFLSTVVNVAGIAAVSYSVTGLSFNTLYYWRVTAVNDGGESDWSTVRSFTTSLNWWDVGTPGFSAGAVLYPSFAIDRGGTPYAVYRDGGNGQKATVMKYNGTSWVTVGTAGFSAGQVLNTSIAIDGSGTPYVAYKDGGNDSKATVMKYNGTSWVTVGTAGFSAGTVSYTSIAIDGSGYPYVAYQDAGNSSKATVKKFDGEDWVILGTAGFSFGTASYTSIAIDGSGTPYVVYMDQPSAYKATVMKYNGTSWVTVGSAEFSAGQVDYTSIAINGNGTPYVAYRDAGNSSKATVMKYNESSWVTVGTAGFSAGQVSYTSIAIDGSGTPYVTYQDNATSPVNKATAMKYEESSWAPLGDAGFSAGQADYTSIAIAPNGIPVVCYSDGNQSSKMTAMKYSTYADDPLIAPPAVPVLATPDNGSTSVSVNPTLTWNAAERASSYTLQVSANDVFSTTAVNQSNITALTYDVSGLNNLTQYYWRVKSVNVGGESDWSTTWSFTTIAGVPTVASFSPTFGPVETSVTITGTNFSPTPANNIVFFGAVRGTVSSATSTSLSVNVPAGATYAPITVTANGLTAYSGSPFIVTFPRGGWITTSGFATKVDFTTGSNPRSIAIGDLDGDGKSDLAVVNSQSTTVSVFRNTSTSGTIASGSYAAKADLATGSSPTTVTIGDIDGDGKPDLVVGNWNDNNVSVFRNTSSSGSISFAGRVNFSTGDRPYGIAIRDLDGDGKPDLAVANYGDNTVSVLRNTSSTGSISFDTKVDFTTGVAPNGVAIGDFDGDEKPDLAVANSTANTVSVFRNTSNGESISFANKVDFTTGTFPRMIAIGDLDGNGKPDLAVGNWTDNTVSVFRNTSTSGSITIESFAGKVDFVTGTTPHGVAIGDLDGDGKPDLAVSNYSSDAVSVFRNTRTSESISLAAKVDLTTGSVPFDVGIGDLDGDGKPDLAVPNYSGTSVSVLRNVIDVPDVPVLELPINGAKDVSINPTLSWSAADRAESYTIQVASDEEFGEETTVVDESGITALTHDASGLSNLTEYFWRVKAVNAGGESEWSNELSFTTIISELAGNYKSKATGNWNDFDSWLKHNGSEWVNAIVSEIPDGTSSITIQSGHTITIPNGTSITIADGALLVVDDGGELTVNGRLTLTSGVLATGENTLTIGPNGSVTRTGGYVWGNLKKPVTSGDEIDVTFEIGSANAYAPVTVSFTSVSNPGSFTASTTDGPHLYIDNAGLNTSKMVNRYWTLTNDNIAFGDSYGATFNYDEADASGNWENYVVRQTDGEGWHSPTVGTKTATSTPITVQSSWASGDFMVGEPATYTLTYTAGENGTITGTSPQTVNHGSAGSAVTAVPAANYHFVKWSDEVLTASRTDLNVTGDISVTATFAIDTYTLTYTAGA